MIAFGAQAPLEQSHSKVIRTDCRQAGGFTASLGIVHEFVPFVSVRGKPQAVFALAGNRSGYFQRVSMDMNESGVGKYFVDKGKPKAIDRQLFDEQWPIVQNCLNRKSRRSLSLFRSLESSAVSASLPCRFERGRPNIGFRVRGTPQVPGFVQIGDASVFRQGGTENCRSGAATTENEYRSGHAVHRQQRIATGRGKSNLALELTEQSHRHSFARLMKDRTSGAGLYANRQRHCW